MSRTVAVRAPTRIDLGGGWTDVPPYCDREGGFVCNVAITRYSMATISAVEGADSNSGSDSDSGLLRAIVRRSALSHAWIGLRNDFPIGAGLGGSSAASAAMLVAAAEWRGDPWDRGAIAEMGRRVEVEDLGVAGGRQDHYAATFGGALALTFTQTVAVRRIALGTETRDALSARSILVYTGQSRISGGTITAVLGAYERRVPLVVTALKRMRELAEQMTVALERADLDTLGALLDEHWQFQRSLHASIPTPLIDEIIRRAKSAGALGAKAMGASGGGCVLILTREGDESRVRSAVTSLGTFVDFGVDIDGVCAVRRE
jgi:D-glycero-alpha-D-manno-heptose-7-phosphate kinase